MDFSAFINFIYELFLHISSKIKINVTKVKEIIYKNLSMDEIFG